MDNKAIQGAGVYPLGEVVKVSLSSTVHQTSRGVRYVFVGWEDEQDNLFSTQSTIHVKLDEKHVVIRARWRKEYLVEVESLFGRVSGEGWYPRGKLLTYQWIGLSSCKIMLDIGLSNGKISRGTVSLRISH